MKKILVIDNHPVILKFMSGLLSKAGYEVLTAEDGLSALDLLQTCIPDVIFIDLIMPNIDGKKLCRIIRRMPDFERVRLVILSGVALEEEIDCAALGADACIAKRTFKEMEESVLGVLESGESALVRHAGKNGGAMWPRQITRELLSDKRHLEVILESVAEGILELNAKGRIIYCNSTARTIMGLSEEDLLGGQFVEHFAHADQERVTGALQRIGAGPQTIGEDSPIRINEKQVSIRFLPMIGSVFGTILIVSDITDKKLMELQLQQAQKMEAIGLLAGGIAHDFNNILTAIVGNVSLAKMYLKKEDKAYAKLVEAEKSAMRARDLTLQLLTFSRGGAPLKKAVSLPEVLQECSRNILKDPAVKCEIRADDNLWPVDVDEGQISHAIQNLLKNSQHAMPGGGLIQISATNRSITGKQELPVAAGKYVEVTVSDQGEGIARENLPKIFDPYFTTKHKGSGLGLTIAYSIVKNHKGCIRVESELGKGTTFCLYLPAALSELGKAATAESGSQGRGKILVMDDEEVVREVVGEMLEVLGYQVEFAAEGETAIRRYAEAIDSQGPFDAVIMDLIVPDGLGGKEAVGRLLQIDPAAKVIVSSGYSEDPVMSEAHCYGFKGVVSKPFRIEDLDRVLQEVINAGNNA
ncbi:ATP-binding response regulator [Desulfoferrobacter suflitae]|uniref:ATP-binding response regulator n=1 Tax=Desulfoferrobacter suflitae TaxID=2865782 RepID=UPI002164AFB8|nr:response regulator [Desulfoferrobacter suflitae]MCK8602904.1 response regulator [Desulfoferrobacter suflitae]